MTDYNRTVSEQTEFPKWVNTRIDDLVNDRNELGKLIMEHEKDPVKVALSNLFKACRLTENSTRALSGVEPNLTGQNLLDAMFEYIDLLGYVKPPETKSEGNISNLDKLILFRNAELKEVGRM